MKRNFLTLGILSLALAACGGGENGIDGKDGKDGGSCHVADNGDGSATITCPDGTSFTIKNGENGKKGDAGSDGEKGQNGESCKLVENSDGSAAVVCPYDGTSYIVRGNTDHYANYCAQGFYGKNCENECPNCGEHGNCNDGPNGDGSCICNKGWDGHICDQCADGYATPECVPASCKNGTPNLGLEGNGECSSCFDKWTGHNCDVCPAGFYDGVTDCVDCTKGVEGSYFGKEECTYTDTRDSSSKVIYPVVKIGKQTWMAENLKATTDINGNNVTCYANTDETKGGVSDFVEKYGCLYVWEDGNKVCPKGWRLPTADEYLDLIGGSEYANWYNTTAIQSTSWNSSASNSTGFGALPAGLRYSDGDFDSFGSYAGFWSATPYVSGDAYSLDVLADGAGVGNNGVDYAFSVRCLKDSN